jgi:hypothetical protein
MMALTFDLLGEKIHGLILERLDNIRYLVPTLLAHRSLNVAFQKRKEGIALEIIQRQINPTFLRYAIANLHAIRFEHLRRDYRGVALLVRTLCFEPKLYSFGALIHGERTLCFEPKLYSFGPLIRVPINDLIRVGHIHELIEGFARHYAESTARHISRHIPPPISRETYSFDVSENEHTRFCCAFYRLELYFNLCRGDQVNGEGAAGSRSAAFFSHHAPWEVEQMFGAYHYMVRKYMSSGMFHRHYGLCNEE